MDTALLIITIVSLAAALASMVALHRLKRSERQRSDARVVALAAAAEAPAAPVDEGGHWTQVAGEWQWSAPRPRAALPRDEAGRDLFAPAQAAPLPLAAPDFSRPLEGEAPSQNLFSTVQREAPASHRFVLAATAALIVALGGLMVVYTTSGHARPATPAAQVARQAPIELVSLGHSHDAGTLSINGIVRNPASGPTVEGLTAVVSLIDGRGGLISTRDVPLDYRALGPGEEAPFKVTVPNPGAVASYRVSFRAGTDVVPHVDRRGDTKLASAS